MLFKSPLFTVLMYPASILLFSSTFHFYFYHLLFPPNLPPLSQSLLPSSFSSFYSLLFPLLVYFAAIFLPLKPLQLLFSLLPPSIQRSLSFPLNKIGENPFFPPFHLFSSLLPPSHPPNLPPSPKRIYSVWMCIDIMRSGRSKYTGCRNFMEGNNIIYAEDELLLLCIYSLEPGAG